MTVVLILDFLFISLSRAMCTHPVGIYLPSVWEGPLSPSEGTALHFGQRKMPICHVNAVTCHSGMPDLTRACWHSALEWVKLHCCSLTAHRFILVHFLYHKTSTSFHHLAWVHSKWLWEQSGGPCRGKKKLCNFSPLNMIWLIPLHPLPCSPSLSYSLTSVFVGTDLVITSGLQQVGRAVGGVLKACHSW